MEDLTKINFIKIIDKERWLLDSEKFYKNKIILNDIENITKGFKQTGYETTRGKLSNYLYNKYYLDLYKKELGCYCFIILVHGEFNKDTKNLETKEIFEYLSIYEYFKRVFNLIFDLLDNFEILYDEIYKVDNLILEELMIGKKISRKNIVKLRVNFISFVNTITKLCENLDILLSLKELLNGKEYVQINKREAYLYFNKLFGGKKENKNYFENIYVIRNYFLHKHSPDFSFYLNEHLKMLIIYENNFKFVLGNFTITAYQKIKLLIDFYFEEYIKS